MGQRRQRRIGRVAACMLGGTVPLAVAASFSITGSVTGQQTLNPGSGQTQSGEVTVGGDLNVAGSTVAVNVTGTGTATITNAGTIRQTGTGRTIDNTGGSNTVNLSISNGAGALIRSADADTIRVNLAGGRIVLDNAGSVISLNPSAGGSQALDWTAIGASGSNRLTNQTGGLIRASAADAVRPGVNGVIVNAGTIEALPAVETSGGVTGASSSDGIDAQTNSGVSVTNTGTIAGRHGITGGASASAGFTITLDNPAGATLKGVNGSGLNIDSNGSFRGDAVVTNAGTILGQFDRSLYNTGDGDGVDVDGLVTLTNTGVIRGTGASGNGSDGLGNNPEGVSIGGGSITNAVGAEISGQDSSGSGTRGHGILVDNSSGGAALAATTIDNAGLIRGYDSYALRLIGNFADTLVNRSTGVIRGGGNAAEGAAIQTGGGNDTLTNEGTISADNGLAIDLQDGDDVLHLQGGSATITGDIAGGSGSNRFDIDGSLTYAGRFSDFDSAEIKGGTVTLSGASSYTGTTTVSAGTLLAAGSGSAAVLAGPVRVLGGATLGGTGRLTTASVEAGGRVAPGPLATTGGTLVLDGDLRLAAGATLAFDAGATPDRLQLGGSLIVEGSGTLAVNIADRGIVPGTDYVLATFAGSSGLQSDRLVLGGVPEGLRATLVVQPGALVLQVAADLALSASSLVFGDAVVGTGAVAQTLTVTNSGGAVLSLQTPAITGAAGGDFRIEASSCAGTLVPAASCTIRVGFAPTVAGSRAAVLTLASDAAGSPATVALSGTGIAARYALQFAPDALVFGEQPVGSASAAQALSVTNTGNLAVRLQAVTAGGAHPADFVLSADTCTGATLAVGAHCNLAITFTPSAAGARSATETVAAQGEATGAAFTAGFGVGGSATQAALALTPEALSFGEQVLGTTSAARAVTVANTGSQALTLTGFATTGDFRYSSLCPPVLAVAAQCTVDVRFAPTSAGALVGTLAVLSSAPASPSVAALDGTGTAAPRRPGRLSLLSARVSVRENAGPALFKVVRAGGAEGRVTVAYRTVDGSALAGEDYVATAGTLTWAAGDSQPQLISVPLLDDALVEGKETFTLQLSEVGGGASLGRSEGVATIVSEDKAGTIEFRPARVEIAENAGEAVLTVRRRGGAGNAVSVHYAALNGSALAGSDYGYVSGDLSWPAGDASERTIRVPITWDALQERKEGFSVDLSAVSGGARLGTGRAQVTIVNVDH